MRPGSEEGGYWRGRQHVFKQRLPALGRHLEKGPQPWEIVRLSALFGFWLVPAS